MTVHNYSDNALFYPSIAYNLQKLRDGSTGHKKFRGHLEELGRLMGAEIAKDLPHTEFRIATPMEKEVSDYVVDNRKFTILGILRAAVPFVAGLVYNLDCPIAYADISRDEKTLEARERRMDHLDLDDRGLIIADPMIATGGTICKALEMSLRQGHPDFIQIVGALGTQHAMERIHEYCIESPHVLVEPEIYLAAIDDYYEKGFIAPGLNETGYIVPGLGDAGDRAFGTM